jgi:Golgi apyrase
MAPSVTPLSTHYALVIDAGSSGSRLQIYSWRDPDLERAEILQEVALSRSGRGGRKWWWPAEEVWRGLGKGKGKGKMNDTDTELETRALRRLVRVGKGVEGDGWVKRVEPGEYSWRRQIKA